MKAGNTSNPRLSLTKAQIHAGIGAELLSLCQAMTGDGSLSDAEITALQNWLQDNRSSDIPAVGFLVTTVEKIIADGKVTKEERLELYKALEIILPPEARKQAKDRRKVIESKEKESARAELELQKQKQREEREHQRPIESANFMVAGVHIEDRPDIIRQFVSADDKVYLARDPQNRYDQNAIEVRLRNGLQIGYVPREDAECLAPLLDKGCLHYAYVTKILTGGRNPIPVVDATLYRVDANIESAVSQSAVPAKRGERGKVDDEKEQFLEWAKSQKRRIKINIPEGEPGEQNASENQKKIIRSLAPNIMDEKTLNELGEWQAASIIDQLRVAEEDFRKELLDVYKKKRLNKSGCLVFILLLVILISFSIIFL